MSTEKVCHVTSVHRRYDPRIFLKMCKSLAKHGYDVTLIVADGLPDEVIEKVKIISVNVNPKNKYKRMMVSSRVILDKAKDIDADIYHIHDSELLPMVSRLRKLGKKVIYDMHEDTPLVIMWKEWIPYFLRKPLSNAIKIYEKIACKKVDAIITVTPFIYEKVKQYCKKSIIITNYPIVNEKVNNDIRPDTKQQVCFAGAISKEWNHENIISALKSCNGVRYAVAGKGDENYINRLKKLNGWQYVNFKGFLKKDDVHMLYNQSFAGIALYDYLDSAGGKEGTLGNTKLFEYMEAGLPVICTNFNVWNNIIKEYKCGICIEPKDTNEISNAINYLHDNPEIAHKMGGNSRRAVLEKYNWNSQEKELLTLYDELLKD